MEMRPDAVIVRWVLMAYLSPVILLVIAVALMGILASKAGGWSDGKDSGESSHPLPRHLTQAD